MNFFQKFATLKTVLIVVNALICFSVNAQPLEMIWSTFLGGTGEDRAHGMALDKKGNIYLTAPIHSTNFPMTPNALNPHATGIYAAKMNAAGDSLLFSTYIGASGGANYAHGIAVDAQGCVYIAGNTTNRDFPTTPGAFDETYNGPGGNVSHGDAFVMKLNPTGTEIIYATFIGGSGMDICGKITVDAEGNAYIVGTTSSRDFPVTPAAFDTTINGGDGDARDDIFVAKLNATGSELIYSTFIGGSSTDLYGENIVVDDNGCVWIAGTTASDDFPTTDNAVDISYNGGTGFHGQGDAFLLKLNASGSGLEYATYIGGSGDDGANNVASDTRGNVFIAGYTKSSDFPTTADAFCRTQKGGEDCFLVKLNPRLTDTIYSTLLGGKQNESAKVAVHPSGTVFLMGSTTSRDFPLTADALDSTFGGGNDLFISQLTPLTHQLKFSTYWGSTGYEIGNILIEQDYLWLAGSTTSRNFPVTTGAFDIEYNGGTNQWGGDVVITKFRLKSSPAPVHKTGFKNSKDFQLQQNFPNPFNPETLIQYSLPKPAHVTLKIFNLQGQEVQVLNDSFQPAGKYSIAWNATDQNYEPVQGCSILTNFGSNQ